TTAKLKATLHRNEPAGVKILKTLRIANCMKSLLLYAGLQNELPTQPGPVDPKYVPMDVSNRSNSDTVASLPNFDNRKKPVTPTAIKIDPNLLGQHPDLNGRARFSSILELPAEA